MTVSVVIPAYNAAATLGEAVASVARQGMSPVEIIVVDDGSTDATPALLAGLPGVRALRTEQRGPAAARNAGLALAGGDLIGFLDADDLWPDGSLAARVVSLAARPDADAAVGRIQLMTLGPGGYAPFGVPWRGLLIGNALFRRRLVERVGLFDESLRRAEDLDWLMRARDAGLVTVEIDALTYVYRLHGGNASADIAARQRAMLSVLHRRTRQRRAP